MITFRAFALMLLFCTPFALARVQLNTTIEFESPWRNYRDTVETEIKLNTDEPAIVAAGFAIKVEACILAEQNDKVIVQYSVSMNNKDDEYELMSDPVFCAEYGKVVTIYEFVQFFAGKQLDSFRVSVVAIQVE